MSSPPAQTPHYRAWMFRIATNLALDALRGNASLEFVALDLRQGIAAVGEIVGKTTTEDLLDAVFSQFCIGK